MVFFPCSFSKNQFADRKFCFFSINIKIKFDVNKVWVTVCISSSTLAYRNEIWKYLRFFINFDMEESSMKQKQKTKTKSKVKIPKQEKHINRKTY